MIFESLRKSISDRRFSTIFSVFCAIITIMICLWAIDVSVTTMNANRCFMEYAELNGDFMDEPPMILTNGWMESDPYLVYHLAIYLLIFTVLMLSALLLWRAIWLQP